MHKPLFLNAPGNIAFSQEHFKTISYAKFGGQTECIMGNWKIVHGCSHLLHVNELYFLNLLEMMFFSLTVYISNRSI